MPEIPTSWPATVDVDAPVERVWALLVETSAWPEWGPTVAAVDGPRRIGPGDSGRVRPPIGPWIPFEITELVEQVRWSWRVAGLPATDHEVAPTATGTRVTFRAPVWAPFYVPVLALGLRRLARLAERAA